MTLKTGGLVAAGNVHTAEAAATILREGGNAFDAIVAALWTACVAEPVLCSLGGGGFLLGAEAGGKPEVIDFFTDTPIVKLPEHALDFESIHANFGSVEQEFHTGLGSVATPGFVAGLFATHERHCTLPMTVLAEPAVVLARRGHALDPFQAYILDVVSPIMLRTGEARRLYGSKRKRSKPLKAGETFKNLDLAHAMERIAREGPKLFYQGELADILVHQQSEHGLLTRDDLSAYKVHIRQPIERKIGSHRLYTNPVPSSGGTLVALQLDLLSHTSASSCASTETWALSVASAMAAASRARAESGLAEEADAEAARKVFSETYVNHYLEALHGRARKSGGTTHVSVVDKEGNVAAATASNGEGCGHIMPGTGIMLNNMLGEEDINPGGFFNWKCGTRISSMMAPTLLDTTERDRVVLGSGGSNRIKSAIFEVASHILFQSSSLEEAVDHPRLHLEGTMLHIEDGFAPEVIESLLKEFPEHHIWEDRNLFFGGVHTARYSAKGLDGVADKRRGGDVRQV